MSKHIHEWSLAEYFQGHLVDVSDKAKMYRPPTSKWLCHCGASKLVEVNDLVATDQEANRDVSNPQSQSSTKSEGK